MSETPDQAATRRRWITLAEVVAVAGVVIAGLTLYSNWADRRADDAVRIAAQSNEAREKARIDLTATVSDDGRILTLADDKHDITDMVLTFPKATGVTAQRPAGQPAIDARWFDDALLKLTDGGADEKAGRLPVLISVSYVDGDSPRSASGLYDIVWRTKGRFLGGRTLKLEGIKLRQRGGSLAALNSAWTRERPRR